MRKVRPLFRWQILGLLVAQRVELPIILHCVQTRTLQELNYDLDSVLHSGTHGHNSLALTANRVRWTLG